MVDFDGTLAPIVADPTSARAVPGAARTLGALAGCFGCVAVVSGRPGDFLQRRLRTAGPSVRLYGLYGMEEVVGGEVRVDPRVSPWLPIVAAAREAAERSVPLGVGLEDKTVSLTIHWRSAPSAKGWAIGFAESQSDRVGLRHRFGRMSVELMPPVDVDKGSVVAALGKGMRAACYFGDDIGDLDAFKALDRIRARVRRPCAWPWATRSRHPRFSLLPTWSSTARARRAGSFELLPDAPAVRR